MDLDYSVPMKQPEIIHNAGEVGECLAEAKALRPERLQRPQDSCNRFAPCFHLITRRMFEERDFSTVRLSLGQT